MDKLNVLIIVADCMRKDSVPLEGGSIQTPHIKDFIADSIYFENAYSHSSWTKTSVASLFTSRLPAAHRVYNVPSALSNEFVTLPQILRDNGYATFCITSNPFFVDKTGFENGFENVRHLDNTDGRYLNDEFRRQIECFTGDPFFIYLHYMDAHPPFNAHWKLTPPEQEVLEKYSNPVQKDMRILKMKQDEVSILKHIYEREIEYLDVLFGEVVDILKRKALYGNTIIVLTSDHGSEFGEHHGVYHCNSVYEDDIRVPLCIKIPGKKASFVEVLVGHIDIMPTLLDYLGFDVPNDMHGNSLHRMIEQEGRGAKEGRLIFSEQVFFPYYRLICIRDGVWKLISRKKIAYGRILIELRHALFSGNWPLCKSTLRRGVRNIIKLFTKSRQRIKRPDWELYNLSEDPREQNNLFDKESDIANEMKGKIEEYEKLRSEKSSHISLIKHDEKIKEQLKALGYLD